MTNAKNTPICRKSFSSDKNARQDVVASIIGEIQKNGIKLAISHEELYLIIDEAITNAMEHGNKWDPGKKISIELETNSYHLYIRIADEGKGFDPSKIKQALTKRNILSTRGRGIYIINQFSKISWNDSGNQIQLAIDLNV